MEHGGADGVCSNYHDGARFKVNCDKYRKKAQTVKEHGEKGIYDIGGRHLVCHPDSNEP